MDVVVEGTDASGQIGRIELRLDRIDGPYWEVFERASPNGTDLVLVDICGRAPPILLGLDVRDWLQEGEWLAYLDTQGVGFRQSLIDPTAPPVRLGPTDRSDLDGVTLHPWGDIAWRRARTASQSIFDFVGRDPARRASFTFEGRLLQLARNHAQPERYIALSVSNDGVGSARLIELGTGAPILRDISLTEISTEVEWVDADRWATDIGDALIVRDAQLELLDRVEGFGVRNLSPTGRWLVASRDSGMQMEIRDLQTSRSYTRATSGSPFDGSARWSGDGRWGFLPRVGSQGGLGWVVLADDSLAFSEIDAQPTRILARHASVFIGAAPTGMVRVGLRPGRVALLDPLGVSSVESLGPSGVFFTVRDGERMQLLRVGDDEPVETFDTRRPLVFRTSGAGRVAEPNGPVWRVDPSSQQVVLVDPP